MEHFLLCLVVIWLKAIFIGSEFDFRLWWKYGKHYTRWYNNRPGFVPPNFLPENYDKSITKVGDEGFADALSKAVRDYNKTTIDNLFALKGFVVKWLIDSAAQYALHGYTKTQIAFGQIDRDDFLRTDSPELLTATEKFADEVIAELKKRGLNCTYLWQCEDYKGDLWEADCDRDRDPYESPRMTFVVTWNK